MKLECRRGISPTSLDMRGIFSSFPPFFKSPGAGVTRAGVSTLRNLTSFPLSTIISAIFIPLLIVIPAPPAPGKLTRSDVE